MNKTYLLKVIEIKKETQDSVSVSFDVPYELYDTFNYKSGQYLTLQFNLKGQQVRRSYSICSSPVIEEPLKIGVKRVKNGLVSNHINDNLKVGDTVEILPPDGHFFVDVKKENYKTYYLFAAGSGITPVLSILKTVLFTEKRSFVYMIFGNRSQETIMFYKELKQLQETYNNRFVLIQTLSKPKSSWSDLWRTQNKEFRKGRVDTACIEWFVNKYPPYAQNVEYYVCGPEKMIDNTVQSLENIDVPFNRIFIESFGGGETKNINEVFENANLIANLKGEIIHTIVPKGKTILRILLDKGKEPPYSCEGGVCSTCICKVKKGKVYMKKNLSLSEKEIAEGYTLSCQSIPLTEEVEVVYE
ncbi:ferredoxin--NADP reductase [Tenacibaculum sp.]|nr:ferredoxin--NADP reductase [Tenacibaculum sp.]